MFAPHAVNVDVSRKNVANADYAVIDCSGKGTFVNVSMSDGEMMIFPCRGSQTAMSMTTTTTGSGAWCCR